MERVRAEKQRKADEARAQYERQLAEERRRTHEERMRIQARIGAAPD